MIIPRELSSHTRILICSYGWTQCDTVQYIHAGIKPTQPFRAETANLTRAPAKNLPWGAALISGFFRQRQSGLSQRDLAQRGFVVGIGSGGADHGLAGGKILTRLPGIDLMRQLSHIG